MTRKKLIKDLNKQSRGTLKITDIIAIKTCVNGQKNALANCEKQGLVIINYNNDYPDIGAGSATLKDISLWNSPFCISEHVSARYILEVHPDFGERFLSDANYTLLKFNMEESDENFRTVTTSFTIFDTDCIFDVVAEHRVSEKGYNVKIYKSKKITDITDAIRLIFN